MSHKSLADRWRTETGQALAEKVLARLIAGRGLGDLNLGEHEGRVDLRGFLAPTPRRLQRFKAGSWFVEQLGNLVKFRSARLEDLDLSGAQLHSFRFHDSQIISCRFDRAVCRDWRLWNTVVTDSSFTNANLREAVVGTWHKGHHNVWRRVNFCGADLRGGVAVEGLFDDCNFTDVNLTKVHFEQCAFMNCRFAGVLRDVLFDGRELSDRPAPRPMEDVDFTSAVFDQVDFMGFDLEHVKLPKDSEVRLIRRYPCVVKRALDALKNNDSLPARMLRGEFENRLRMMRTDKESNIFNRRDYFASGGEELAALAAEVLSRAEADCLKSG
jgi:uncharacterized protein YjbI with pentapeptide repeats